MPSMLMQVSFEFVDPEVDNEEITGLEAGYRFRGKKFALNIDIYRTEWANRFLNTAGPELPNGNFSRYRLTSVGQIHQGLEFDFEYRPVGGKWRLKGFGSIGNWKFEGDSPFTQFDDDTATIIDEGEIGLTGTKVGSAPQTSFGVSGYLNILDNLSIDADYNVYTDLYGLVDPEDVVDASLRNETFQSPRLPSYDLVDFGLTYKFNLGDQRVTFRGNVKNLFNSPYINQLNAFGYFLGVGRTWNASLNYKF